MSITVLGAGAWGTALGKVLSAKGELVTIWTWPAEIAEQINEGHENRAFLPGVPLGEGLRATPNMGEALRGADLVILALPSQALRSVVREARTHIPPGAAVVSGTKGIENDSLMLMREVLIDVLGDGSEKRVAALSGPSFAKEVALGLPTALVIASSSQEVTAAVQQRCATERFRVYTSDDPIGVEVGGALKNVIAIATGASDALGYGHNARAALITRGIAEIARLTMAKGGNALTLAGLAGLGDLVLTCTGDLSRNRTVGAEMGRGKSLREVLDGLGHVAEGVTTAKSAYELSQRLGVDMPITLGVYQVLYENKPLRQAVSDLMSRQPRPEF
jgi:glycerol-3-phosphate dehydrogenase (NAD(P)+)